MNYIKKNEWVNDTKFNIRARKLATKVLRSLIDSDLVKSYNGKRITKVFTDKLQATLPENVYIFLTSDTWVNPHINIVLKIDMEGVRNRTGSYFRAQQTWVLSQYERDPDRPIYLPYNRKLNYDNLVTCIKRDIEVINKQIQEEELCIKNINKYQKAYAKLEKCINDTLESIPLTLRTNIFFRNPIFDD